MEIRIPATDDIKEVDWWRQTVSNMDTGSAGSTKFKIGFLSDSSIDRINHSSIHWLYLLKTNLESKRCFVDLVDSSIGGHTFYKTYAQEHAIHGATTLEYLISQRPDVIIIHLGHNDMFQGRTMAQLKVDVDTVLSRIKTALPNCYIVYASEHWFNTLKNPSQLLNCDVFPSHMALRTSGLFANARCATMLDDACSSNIKEAATRWVEFNAYVSAKSEVNKTCISPLWRGTRLGVTIEDLLHANQAGQALLAMVMAEIIYELRHFPALKSFFLYDDYRDKFTHLFYQAVSQSGNTFINNPTQLYREFLDRCNTSIEILNNWFRQYKTEPMTFFPSPLYYSPKTILTFLVRNGKPNSNCYGSHSNYWIYMGKTNPSGNILISHPITSLVPHPGQYNVNFKVGDEVYEVGWLHVLEDPNLDPPSG